MMKFLNWTTDNFPFSAFVLVILGWGLVVLVKALCYLMFKEARRESS